MTRRVLIVVRTYPMPARKGIEVSCTAAITQQGEWIRLYPVPYRFLNPDQRFGRYQWIEVQVRRARNDYRPESHNLIADTIKIVSSIPAAKGGWAARRDIIEPLRRKSLCEIERTRTQNGAPTLGIFRPAHIDQLKIEKLKSPDWTPREREILSQQLLAFGEGGPKMQLAKIPFEFRYEFRCDDPSCAGHDLSCTDWEMGQSYRSWRSRYGEGWQEKFRDRFERDMIDRNDTSFFVGTVHQHPNRWIIVGLFYPPKATRGDLFAA